MMTFHDRPSGAAVLLSTLLLAGCATRARGARPDDMSAMKHRRTAAAERREAKRHAKKYDPHGDEQRAATATGAALADIDVAETYYNPTERHRFAAAKHREHARQHEQAAKALLSFEKKSCTAIKKAARASCPLLGRVIAVKEIDSGVRMRIAPKVSLKLLLAHVRCHYAFGRKVGREGMSACPLYLKHLTIKRGPASSIDITTADKASVKALRARARAHVVSGDTK